MRVSLLLALALIQVPPAPAPTPTMTCYRHLLGLHQVCVQTIVVTPTPAPKPTGVCKVRVPTPPPFDPTLVTYLCFDFPSGELAPCPMDATPQDCF